MAAPDFAIYTDPLTLDVNPAQGVYVRESGILYFDAVYIRSASSERQVVLNFGTTYIDASLSQNDTLFAINSFQITNFTRDYFGSIGGEIYINFSDETSVDRGMDNLSEDARNNLRFRVSYNGIIIDIDPIAGNMREPYRFSVSAEETEAIVRFLDAVGEDYIYWGHRRNLPRPDGLQFAMYDPRLLPGKTLEGLTNTGFTTEPDAVLDELTNAVIAGLHPRDGTGELVDGAVDLGSSVSPFGTIFLGELEGLTDETGDLIELAHRTPHLFLTPGQHTFEWPYDDSTEAMVLMFSGDGGALGGGMAGFAGVLGGFLGGYNYAGSNGRNPHYILKTPNYRDGYLFVPSYPSPGETTEVIYGDQSLETGRGGTGYPSVPIMWSVVERPADGRVIAEGYLYLIRNGMPYFPRVYLYIPEEYTALVDELRAAGGFIFTEAYEGVPASISAELARTGGSSFIYSGEADACFLVPRTTDTEFAISTSDLGRYRRGRTDTSPDTDVGFVKRVNANTAMKMERLTGLTEGAEINVVVGAGAPGGYHGMVLIVPVFN